MALISCSVFKAEILAGSKFHTIRDRKNPPEVGEHLFLWWKSRTPEKEFLGVTICTQVDPITIDCFNQKVTINEKILTKNAVKVLAKNDGFKSVDDFWKFFDKPISAFLIHWNPAFINRSRLRPEVMAHAQLSSDIVEENPRQYNPSSGTAGMEFISRWCENCDRDKNKTKVCPVLHQALNDKTPHWIRTEGTEICTSFIPMKVSTSSTAAAATHKSLQRKGQLNLLEQG